MISEFVAEVIAKWGQPVAVVLPGEQKIKERTRAFIQSLRYKDKNFFGWQYIDVGCVNADSYIYIGHANVRLDLYPFNTVVCTGNQNYLVRNAKAFYIGEKIAYIRAVLQLDVQEVLQ